MTKLRLGFYPYAYARVSVMKSELVKPLQWQSLLKMGTSEILRNLQDGNYKVEIDELGVEKRDLAALEMALNKNLMRTFTKLRRISDEKVREVIRIYLQRYDVENFKTIIRGKMTGIASEDIEELLMPSVNHPDEYFVSLLKKEKIEDTIKALPFKIKPVSQLFEIENALDRAYFEELFQLSKNLVGQGTALKEFIQAEIEILNIKMILRLKKENMTKEDILTYLIHPQRGTIKLLDIVNIRDIIKAVHRMKYTTLKGDEPTPEEELVTQLEIDLDTTLLKKEVLLMHQFPLTVNVILGFMFSKEIEVKNLKILLKGKQLGIEDNYLNKLLVVA